MANETINPGKLAEMLRRASLPPLGATLCDISTVDATPSRGDPDGNALFCQGLNAQIAGLVKVDMADGATGMTLAVVAGNNRMAITKVYKTGTDVGLVGKLAFLW